MLVVTLDHMARGGLYDQLAFGFHRYSTDGQWLVPHFEKMLYDNAELASVYAAADHLAPDAGFARVARETLAFVTAEMTGPHGAFLSAIDAETDGHEGFYYTWTRDELKAALGPDDDAFLAPIWGFDGAPNFEHTRYVLHLPRPLAEVAQAHGLSLGLLLARIDRGRKALLGARAVRERPLVDDKVLADWNGLMMAGFAEVGRLGGDAVAIEAARRAASFVLQNLRDATTGELLHTWREGRARVAAFLDDYAFLVHGLLSLHAATGEPRWLAEAERLVREQEARLGDPAGGYFAAGAAPDLLFRAKSAFDGAVASGNGVAAQNLLDLHRVTGDAAYRVKAEGALSAFGADLGRVPLAHVTLVRVAARLGTVPPTSRPVAAAPRAIVVAGTEDLEDEAREAVVVLGRLAPGHEAVRAFTVELKVSRGFHVYANPPGAANLPPTTLVGVLGRLVEVKYPAGEKDAATGDGVLVYRGGITLEGQVEMPKTGAPSVELRYQACDDTRCLPEITRLVRLE